MKDLSYFDEQTIAELVEKIRALRVKIAHRRIADTTNRYPEISMPEIKPLNQTQTIILALERELFYQEKVSSDIDKAAGIKAAGNA